MKVRFFASVAVLASLVLYVGAIFFCFAFGYFWPLVACPVFVAVAVGVANYVEYLTAKRS